MLAIPAVPADSMEEAKFLSTTSYQRILSLFRGQPLWMKPPVESMNGLWNAAEEAGVKDFLGLQVIGNADDLKQQRSEEHTSELQSRPHLVCRLLLEKKNQHRY